jgi:hypothetical protein
MRNNLKFHDTVHENEWSHCTFLPASATRLDCVRLKNRAHFGTSGEVLMFTTRSDSSFKDKCCD